LVYKFCVEKRSHLLVLLILGITLAVFFALRQGWLRDTKARTPLINSSIGLFSLIWTLIILETCFRVFVLSSDGFGHTLASRQWFAQYWKPINSLGYRNIEHDPTGLNGKKVLFVVGDSFVAGHGTNHPRDRFSDVLGKQLGDEWEVFNMAKNGWDTKDELTALRDFPLIPDVIILSYYINDIDGTASRVWGQPRPSLVEKPHRFIRPVVKRSHLFHFFYWRVYRFQNSSQMGGIYRDYLERAHKDENVSSIHEKELLQIVDWAEKNEVRLVAVVFPLLVDIEWGRQFTEKIVRLFSGKNVPVVNLPKALKGRDPQELVVNNFDVHPSVQLHEEVASLLYAELVNQ